MSPRKQDAPSPDYPKGPRTITFSELDEDSWWALLHALEVRISFFQQQRASYQRLNDPGMERHIHCCDDSIARLRQLLQSAQQQLSPSFFRRKGRRS